MDEADGIAKTFFEDVVARFGGLQVLRHLDMRNVERVADSCGYGVPRYIILSEAGPDHDRTFTVEVHVGNKITGIGVGKNKKDAEQAAAAHALGKIAGESRTP
mgnify:CR=1 FL=1